jgi:hypothetical protein
LTRKAYFYVRVLRNAPDNPAFFISGIRPDNFYVRVLRDAPDNPAFFISGIRPDTGYEKYPDIRLTESYNDKNSFVFQTNNF